MISNEYYVFFNKLSEIERQVILLKFVYNLTYEEIAEQERELQEQHSDYYKAVGYKK